MNPSTGAGLLVPRKAHVDSREPIQKVIDALSVHHCDPRETKPGGWKAQCPAHPDDHPSLSVGIGNDGRVLLHCYAHCENEDVVGALGLTMADLFEHSSPSAKGHGTPPRLRKFPTLDQAIAEVGEMFDGTCSHHWSYQNADGSLFCVQARYAVAGGGRKEFRPFSQDDEGRWIVGQPRREKGSLRPLYRLAEVADAEIVYVVEGEKCVEMLRWLGLVAVTSLNGSASSRCTDWRPLAGKRVLILPDADEPGRKYATDVAQILDALYPRPQVEVSELQGMEPGGDAYDWLMRDKWLVEVHCSQANGGMVWDREGARMMFLLAVKQGVCDGFLRSRSREAKSPPRPSGSTMLADCVAFLRGRLASGPVPATTMDYEIDGQWGSSTITKAKKTAGVRSVRLPLKTGWYWTLSSENILPILTEDVAQDVA